MTITIAHTRGLVLIAMFPQQLLPISLKTNPPSVSILLVPSACPGYRTCRVELCRRCLQDCRQFHRTVGFLRSHRGQVRVMSRITLRDRSQTYAMPNLVADKQPPQPFLSATKGSTFAARFAGKKRHQYLINSSAIVMRTQQKLTATSY